MGPSVFTGPEYIQELFELCGENFSEFKYQKLSHSFNYFFEDGLQISLPADKEKLINELSEKLNESKSVLKTYLEKAELNYNLISPLFIEKSLHRFKHLLNKNLLKALIYIPKYKLNSTMNGENATTFKNPKTVRLFNRYATYNGSNPYEAPAMLNMIQHLEMNVGVFLPEKGMVQISEAVYQLALKKGVTFHLNEAITNINIENKNIKGVSSKKADYLADVVVSNMDVSLTYEKLMPEIKQPQKILNQEKSSSAVVFYWGIKKEFKELGVHNILFSNDSEKEFNDIFKTKKQHNDPTIYINITSKEVKSDAPMNCENWFVMINSAINTGQNWDEELKNIKQRLIKKINKLLNTTIEDYIECEEILSPEMIEKRYSGKFGSIYGNASNNKYAAFYRHPNYSKEIKGLYFVGVTVHPGGGIPLALNSAKIAIECLKEDLAK
jgi:phytoene desaturase